MTNDYSESFILIGPMGSGKSGFANLLQDKYGLEVIRADNLETQFLNIKGIEPDYFRNLLQAKGIDEMYKEWESFALDFVIWILKNVREKKQRVIIDFGCYHTAFFDRGHIERLKEELRDFHHVIEVIPAEDKDISFQILNQRKRYDSVDAYLTQKILNFNSNDFFATDKFYTGCKSFDQLSDDFLRCLNVEFLK